MKVLVTGANGLLGHHVVFELVKRKIATRIIVRNLKNIHFDLNLLEVFDGNFTDYESLKLAAQSCDAIIHIAAVTATDLMSYDEYFKVNVEATSQVLKIANELNINKIIYVSTTNTVGFGNKNTLADEQSPIEYPFSKSFYAQSKVEAEKIILEASKQSNKHYIIINPSFMIGAFDTKPSSGKLMLLGYRKPLMFVPKGGKNFVSAGDVAVSICNALTQGKNGERYLASGINLSFKEFYKLQKETVGYKQLIFEIPNFLLSIIGVVGDLARKMNIKTEICSMNLNQLKIREYYSNKKAKLELNLPCTDLKIAVKEAIEWFYSPQT